MCYIISGRRKSIRKEELVAAAHTKTIFHIGRTVSTGFRALSYVMCQLGFLSQADSVSGCAASIISHTEGFVCARVSRIHITVCSSEFTPLGN
jgi:hypothetical protein